MPAARCQSGPSANRNRPLLDVNGVKFGRFRSRSSPVDTDANGLKPLVQALFSLPGHRQAQTGLSLDRNEVGGGVAGQWTELLVEDFEIELTAFRESGGVHVNARARPRDSDGARNAV